MNQLFSIWFYTLTLLFSAVFIPLMTVALALCRPFLGKRRTLRNFRLLIRFYGRIIVSVLPLPFIRVRYTDLSDGKERRPVVYISNHRSSSDPFLLSVLPGELIQIVNIWPFRLPILGPLARRAGYLSIREMSFAEFNASVGRNLKNNVSILAFPEGTRSASRRLGTFHGALFRACLEHGPTLAPVCIMDNEDQPRRGSLTLHPGIIRIHRLPGVPYEKYRNMTPFALKSHVRALIENHIRNVEGEPHEKDNQRENRLRDA